LKDLFLHFVATIFIYTLALTNEVKYVWPANTDAHPTTHPPTQPHM